MDDREKLLPGILKYKRFCLRHGWTAVTVLAVVGVVLVGFGVYAGLSPGSETVTKHRAGQTITAETNVSAVVGPESSLWAEGTRLKNRPAYMLQDSPEATIDARISVSNGTLSSADPVFRLKYSAVREDETIWQRSRPLNTTVNRSGDGVVASTSVNASTVAKRIRDREQDVGRAATVQTVIVLEIPYETDRYDGTLVAEFPITVDGPVYELDPARVTERRTTPVQVDRLSGANSPLVFALLMLGTLSLAGAGAASRVARDQSSEEELLELEQRIEHARYEEWISVGEFPLGGGREFARLERLDDLVNLAVDVNGRVIYDRERDAYAVVTRDVVYYVGERSAVVPEWQFGEISNVADQD